MLTTDSRLKVIHVVSDMDDRYGGPAVSVPSLARELEHLGIETEICSVRVHEKEHNTVAAAAGLRCSSFKLVGPRIAYYAPGLYRALRRAALEKGEQRLLIHLHSLWTWPAWAGLKVARRHGVPLVTSPRSNLYPASLQRSAGRKLIARRLFVDRLLAQSACLHATEEGEASAIRSMGLGRPIALVPNGVDMARFERELAPREARERLGLPPNRSYLLFLSRIHPRKGVDMLLDVWRDLARLCPEWDLLLAGPIDDPALERRLAGSGEAGRVRYLGMLRGDDVVRAYKAADLFTLPSQFENFGNAIAEALASGLPVVTTKGTPWPQIEEAGAGAWIDANPQALRQALLKIMQAPSERRRAMGEAGLPLARHFTWPDVARRMLDVYDWVLKGESPAGAEAPGQEQEALRFAP